MNAATIVLIATINAKGEIYDTLPDEYELFVVGRELFKNGLPAFTLFPVLPTGVPQLAQNLV